MYRVVREGLDPLATAGSLQAGGRFNSPGEFGALYTSFEAATAVQEVGKALRQRGIDPTQFPPGSWWIYELEVVLGAILDLTDSGVLRQMRIQKDSLMGSDLGVTRKIAAEAREAGCQALLVPSAAVPESRNLVIFPDKLPGPLLVLSSRPVDLR